jgi:hypothetical protein
MMNRIFKRPMFRMGGRSDDGIMSVRPGYQSGGSPLTTPDLYLQAQKVKEEPFLTLKDITKKYEDAIGSADLAAEFGDVEDLGGPGTFADESIGIAQFLRTPEGEKFFKKPLLEERDKQIVERKDLGLPIPDSIELPKDNTKNELDKLKNLTKKDTSSEFERYFKEYLPVIQEQLKPDSDASKRTKFLELAKVGLNLLGQPGGDLVGAIGRAAAPSITNLQTLAEKDREEKLQPRLLALQAAMKRMEGPTATQLGITAKRIESVAENLISNYGLTADASYKVANSLDNLRERESPLAGKFNKKRPNEEKDLPKKGKHYYFTDDGELTVYDADKKEFLDIKEAEAI